MGSPYGGPKNKQPGSDQSKVSTGSKQVGKNATPGLTSEGDRKMVK